MDAVVSVPLPFLVDAAAHTTGIGRPLLLHSGLCPVEPLPWVRFWLSRLQGAMAMLKRSSAAYIDLIPSDPLAQTIDTLGPDSVPGLGDS